MNHEIAIKIKRKEWEEKITLEWFASLVEAVLLTWCFPLVRHGFGGFFWRRKTRGSEMMEVCTSGFAEHRRSYFISSGNASGVMTGRRALMRIPNDGGFP
jgi:hypothetical protein